MSGSALPAGQLVQLAARARGWYVPPTHEAQAAAEGGLEAPGPQSAHEAPPTGALVPAGQAAQLNAEVAPGLGLALPAAQLTHSHALARAKEPAAHTGQEVWADALWLWPAGQAAQALKFEPSCMVPRGQAPHTGLPPAATKPGAHASHPVWPGSFWKRPAGQAAQKRAWAAGAKEPGAHSGHTFWPSCGFAVPLAQLQHTVWPAERR